MRIFLIVLLMTHALFGFNLDRDVSTVEQSQPKTHTRVQRHLIQMPLRYQPWRNRPRYPWGGVSTIK